MFVPGNNPAMMADAFIYGPDSIMLDLEDSVTMAEKDAARLLVHNALKTIDYGNTEMVVRVNPLNTPYGKKDVEAVVKAGVHVIRMPKTETADEIRELEAEIVGDVLGKRHVKARKMRLSVRVDGIELIGREVRAGRNGQLSGCDGRFYNQYHKEFI